MSRGLGAVQRAVLELISAPEAMASVEDGRFGTRYDGSGAAGVSVDDLIRLIADSERPTRAQAESVRRAVRTLRGTGRLEVRRGRSKGHERGRHELFVCGNPTAAELERRVEGNREADAFFARLRRSTGAVS